MATLDQCRTALTRLSENLSRANGGLRSAAALDRSVSCQIIDLNVTFVGRLADGKLNEVVVANGGPTQKAEIRLAMTGDDLVDLVAGRLNFTRAWATGQVRLEAGFRDLLRLRSLL